MAKNETTQEFAAMEERMKALPLRVQEAVGRKTAEHVEFILKRAKDNAPVQTGELRDSGHIVPDPNSTPAAPSGLVVFDAPHALAVHERDPSEDQAHQDETTPEGHRGRKFATRAAEFHHEAFVDDIAETVRTAMEKTE